MGNYAFGVDVGGTTVKLGLFDLDGRVLDKWEIPTVKDNEGASILPDVAESIRKKMKEKGIEEKDLVGIGIGVPGAVDAEELLWAARSISDGGPLTYQKRSTHILMYR